MTTYAWVIDQTTCIGCHACTTACKSENDVPLGVNRTWVKYVETGTFPATRRQIAVLRCNHCADPPCVEICPTGAMFQRPDGIVDFNTAKCIGCKACIQACPYDAIYIDPDEHVAEKCNFCSHRVDRGLLPACVVVCPTESLVFGDLDDPTSRASRVVASRPTTVRRPEQGTLPKAFYVGAAMAVLDPLAPVHGADYQWGSRRMGGAQDHTAAIAGWASSTAEPWQLAAERALPVVAALPGAALAVPPSPPPALGSPIGPRPVDVGRGAAPPASPPDPAPAAAPPPRATPARRATAASSAARPGLRMPAARVAFDVFHPRPWGWPVAAYLWTKGFAAGAFVLVFLAGALGLAEASFELRVGAAFVSLAFLGLTALLLVGDLKRPERFWQILVHAQRRSWLAIGAFILTGYAGLLGLWFLGTLAGIDSAVLLALGWPAAALGILTALYTAFLLGQCEGRDLWQNPVVGFVLLAQATILGATVLLVLATLTASSGTVVDLARLALAAGAAVNVVALVLGEAMAEHTTTNARAAAHLLVRGPYWPAFWLGGVVLAGALPIVAVAAPLGTAVVAEAGVVAAVGLLWYELGFVTAGQAVPIS